MLPWLRERRVGRGLADEKKLSNEGQGRLALFNSASLITTIR